jgi:hypothetical protein
VSWEDILKVYGPAVAWNAFCLQLFILPFFRKRESMLKDYVTDGVLDAAKSYIEANRLIPTLASLFMRVRDAQGDRRRSLSESQVQEILQQVDYIAELSNAQEALAESNRLDSLYESMEREATLIWLLGLMHVIGILFLTVGFWASGSIQLAILLSGGILASVTLVLAIGYFLVFGRKMNAFLQLIKKNRQAGGPHYG